MSDLDAMVDQIGAIVIVRDGVWRGRDAELTVRRVRDAWQARLWWDPPPGGYPTTWWLGEDGWTKGGPPLRFVSASAALDAAAALGWEAA